ncbi:MAG: glutamate racemase [Cyclobacteriaceae bacterium]
MKSNAPIGIFDSGIGGLTVARAVKALLPAEQLIYFGDTAHLPYGDKSTAAIQAYSVKITDFLLSKGCKVVLIACNSASAAAYELVKEYAGSRAQVFNVIDPVVGFIREHYKTERIGLIGTKQTVNSGVYADKIKALKSKVEISALATPLLVPLIEEGFVNNEISHGIIKQYLEDPELSDITSLILGCTHYPIIKGEIEALLGDKVEVIDSAETVAKALKGFLDYHQLSAKSRIADDQFFISDFTTEFEFTTKRFFGKHVHLDSYRLWE